MKKETMIDLLWPLGISPRLAGYRYLLRTLELLCSGADITPELVQTVADAFSVNRSSAYSAMKAEQERSHGYRPDRYEALMANYGSSLYDFIYALSRQL